MPSSRPLPCPRPGIARPLRICVRAVLPPRAGENGNPLGESRCALSNLGILLRSRPLPPRVFDGRPFRHPGLLGSLSGSGGTGGGSNGGGGGGGGDGDGGEGPRQRYPVWAGLLLLGGSALVLALPYERAHCQVTRAAALASEDLSDQVDTSRSKVSIVIPCLNEEKAIGPTLQYLNSLLDPKPFEARI